MKCLVDDSNIGSTTSYLEVANPFLDSACVTNLEYFLFKLRPIEMCPCRKSKETYGFSSANPLTDRKLCPSPMRSYLYSMIMSRRTEYDRLGSSCDLAKISFA